MKVSVKAYAKINLFLDMVSKRPDGYHNILSIMQSVSLYDDVTVEYSKDECKKIEVVCGSAAVPCDMNNLAYKAAEKYPCVGIIRINIDKRIPVSAGLAGGSADAAATLIALNKIFGDAFSKEELKSIGASIGADVPFCIECGTYLTEGIGEKMSEFVKMPDYPIVIAKKGDGMSTPAAYRKLDLIYNDFRGYNPKTERLDVLKNAELPIESYCSGIYNIFEEAVEPERPCVTEIKSVMTECGAINATMSGSGTSVFGIFKSEDDARKAICALQKSGADANLCYPCDSHGRVMVIS